MKVTVLVDNNDGEGLKGEWGLSFYIEYKGTTVLLDAGLSPLFAQNAEKMGIRLCTPVIAPARRRWAYCARSLETWFTSSGQGWCLSCRPRGEN